ncbi:MAG: NAD(P)/FAD-dependent oxidoreductase [Candidatus Omnitrophota bacterium]|nr:NAD(P)/FAD-dependent oxidoreductase [Candidatus Omnitrophota bacterium]
MGKFSVAVVGGGASGLTAAISAKRKGSSVIVCEKMPFPGKKIAASGNGRCNLLNEKIDETHYNKEARRIVKTVFGRFGKDDIVNFFNELGLPLFSEDGRMFPVTNQSASVLKILEIELKRLAVQVETDFEISDISHSKNGFIATAKSGKAVESNTVILTGGGKTYPALGSDGGAYKLAVSLGHRIVEPVPVSVPLVTRDPLCHLLQGQRIRSRVKGMIGKKLIGESSGELLFTKYGLSGNAILDLSEDISLAINRYNKDDVFLLIDMAPFMTTARLKEELKRRMAAGFAQEELIAGILPNKFGAALKDLLTTRNPDTITDSLKARRFKITGARGWNEADFTAGGVDLNDIDEHTLESRLTKGLYFAGEILDVNGARGGYNLAWAWASGFVAGEEASLCAG